MSIAPEALTASQLAGLAALAGLPQPLTASLVKRHNHVYRLTAGEQVYYLKTYTKDWYGDDAAATGYCVEHEARAWDVLAGAGLVVPEVALAQRDGDNPLDRPFIFTRQLAGAPLTALLETASTADFSQLLQTTGAYLRAMHSITFAYPGYIAYDGPAAPLDPAAWQHPIWSAAATQREAEAILAADRDRIPPDLAAELAERFSGMAATLAPAFAPPRYTHGDCHAHQFFLLPDGAGWRVTGVLDMEVASAGDCVADLIKLAIELTAHFPPSTRWWEPLFAGYGGAPDFEAFKLRLLGRHEIEFKAHGEDLWPADRETTLRRLLAAADWAELFAAKER